MNYRDSLFARQLLVDEFVGHPLREQNAIKKAREDAAVKRATKPRR